MRDEDKTAEYEDEWKYAAMVIDRICAFVFFTGLFIAFAVTVCVGAAQNWNSYSKFFIDHIYIGMVIYKMLIRGLKDGEAYRPKI